MRVTYVLAAVVAMGISAFGVFKLLGKGPPQVQTNLIKVEKSPSSGLAIPLNGPHPKAVVDASYEFGRMEVGEERTHVFTIRNEGAAPLIIENAGTTCQCTVSDLKQGETRRIAPGDSFDIKLTWKPTAQSENFSKGANFDTNDPDHKRVFLQAVGMVAPRMVLHPEKEWFLSNVTDDKPGVFSGTIISPIVDQFQIIAVESSSPLVSAEVFPLAKE